MPFVDPKEEVPMGAFSTSGKTLLYPSSTPHSESRSFYHKEGWAMKPAKGVKSGASTLKKKGYLSSSKDFEKGERPQVPSYQCSPEEQARPLSNFEESKTILKERFRSFNIAFEEVYKSQTGWLILDP
ncbi:hypothetical protein IFM89_017896 [Coptis chinensis]|uniref:Exocyst complex subunit Exo70 C-terminal domain-containing protein n=1 Tax=Coptis chinensis TaxID=261450 RepID=A0A835LYH8_9MAGN|nr:hypothetical protein IFM89_017896 [Coptis chinensis]